MPENCREKIVSEDYVDFLWKSNWSTRELEELYPNICIQTIASLYAVFYVNAQFLEKNPRIDYPYEAFPTLFGLMETESLEAANILQLQNQPVLKLKGQGVILGFIDTGIDYTNACFRDPIGNSRILEIWDQNIQTGTMPDGIGYGSVYSREDINRALASEDPLSVVPSTDELGHGTKTASIAAGSLDETSGWIGAAPLSDIAMVKLKPAKSYLKEYFAVKPDAVAYQENDIMLGVRYLNDLALREKKPLVLCLALGTNMGGHSGTSPLSGFLNIIGSRPGRSVVLAGGNEADQGHHFFGTLQDRQEYQEVELRVANGEYGLMMELWGSTPDVLAISMTSPTGETIPRISSENGDRRFDFLFEEAVIYVDFQALEARSGDQLIVIRMFNPTPGIWTLRIYGTNVVSGVYNIWLPIAGFLSEETEFLSSNPDITLTDPANAEGPITIAAYQSANNSIYLNSSRGFTRKGRIKPDLTAPGVEVRAYGPQNQVTSLTGTSAAAAITAGAAALMLEWAVVRGHRPDISNLEIKQLLIRGANRDPGKQYPSRSWGYGTLDLYASFEALGRFSV